MRAPEGYIAPFTTQTTKKVDVANANTGHLYGGYYQISAVCSTWNSASLQLKQLGPDGSTYLSIGSAITANGVALVYLPPGVYEWTVSTGTPSATLYASVARVPND